MALFLLAPGPARAAGPRPAQGFAFQVGIYADDTRSGSCVRGGAGSMLHYEVWASVPEGLGTAYVTLRFAFPDNLDLRAHPVFNAQMDELIMTDFPDGTAEWNMVFRDCPSGWIQLFTQEFTPLDDKPAHLTIHAADSMLRDCAFLLNGVEALSELSVNDPLCSRTPVDGITWSELKSIYR